MNPPQVKLIGTACTSEPCEREQQCRQLGQCEPAWTQDMLMGVIGADGKKHCLFASRAEEVAAVVRSPLKVATDLMALSERVGALIPHGVDLPDGGQQ